VIRYAREKDRIDAILARWKNEARLHKNSADHCATHDDMSEERILHLETERVLLNCIKELTAVRGPL